MADRRNPETAESIRLREAREGKAAWKMWGPYLSERQWGTVREDYSADGDAWSYFSHDQARSRAYRWGEDGLAGISDEKQRLCFGLALWNDRDPILKERPFGLTNSEGNHGEDVKEYYFYLDSTPTHSYMRYLYKYPQAAFPYLDLKETNLRRSRHELEYELLDTGVFQDDRYFDVFVEYAKGAPEDILARISIFNRGPDTAPLDVLPTLWFRNTWARGGARPSIRALRGIDGTISVAVATHQALGERFLYAAAGNPLLFTENETNNRRLFGGENATAYVKDGINDFIVSGRDDAVNPEPTGTKMSIRHHLEIPPGATAVVRLRLSNISPTSLREPFAGFDRVVEERRQDADLFYAGLTPPSVDADSASILRQAMAGMLWSKQYYHFDADLWLREHQAHPFQLAARASRNSDWFHMVNDSIISMPDKWEYPWYAAWDLAFHAMALSTVDVDFAKEQLGLVLEGDYIHPNGQIPAYEWNFSDVNPPVHAWATNFLERTERALRGQSDIEFLKSMLAKLAVNFTWWVNRKDRFGKNVFEGGFLGLDNIGVFDRSAPLPTGGHLEQADGTAWMALFCQNMLELSVEVASRDRAYADMAAKFAEHFLWIAHAVNRVGNDGMWDEEDGFYYDVLRLPDGSAKRLKVRSVVGLLPMCATTIIEPAQRERVPEVIEHLAQRVKKMPELLEYIHPTGPGHLGVGDRGILALADGHRLRRLLTHMLDEDEFLGPFGIRSLSRYHKDHPYCFDVHGEKFCVGYLPADSDSGMFGGNSNWRGPVWMPINVLLIRALLSYYLYYGDGFRIECPTRSGHMMNLFEVAGEITRRLIAIFKRDDTGRRPVFGGSAKFNVDPYWRDNLLFYEYFNGDDGAGVGASHQTGWTGIIGRLIQIFGSLDAEKALSLGVSAAFRPAQAAATP